MTNFEILKDIVFDNSYSHTIDFVSREIQETFFDDLVELSFDDFTTVKENEEVKVPQGINDLQGLNYCRFTNTVKGKDKTFFAFILSKEYVNPETTRLKLEVDVFQTYMFGYDLKESFVSRQHKDRFSVVGNKLKQIFDNTKENLDYGSKYYEKNREKMGSDFISIAGVNYPVLWYYITASDLVGNLALSSTNTIQFNSPTRQDNLSTNYYSYVLPLIPNVPNVPLGVIFRLLKNNTDYELITMQELKELSEQVSILTIQVSNKAPFTYTYTTVSSNDDEPPYSPLLWTVNLTITSPTLTNVRTIESAESTNKSFIQLVELSTLETKIFERNIPLLDMITIETVASKEYEPKLKTNPYNYIKIKSGDNEKTFEIEDFEDKIEFSKIKSVSSKGTSMIIPKNYKGAVTNFNESLIVIDENNVAIRTDKWNEYESQNKANLRSGLLVNAGGSAFNSLLSAGIGVTTGNPFAIAGAVTSGVSIGTSIANEMLKREDIKKSPDTLQSTGDDILLKHNLTGLQDLIIEYEIEDDFKQRLFKYFQYFGYSSNSIEVPNLSSRYYYNYIKTIGTTIVANLDNEIIQKLKQIFENGVTIWHYRDPLTFKGMLNYNYENVEMTIHSTQGA